MEVLFISANHSFLDDKYNTNFVIKENEQEKARPIIGVTKQTLKELSNVLLNVNTSK